VAVVRVAELFAHGSVLHGQQVDQPRLEAGAGKIEAGAEAFQLVPDQLGGVFRPASRGLFNDFVNIFAPKCQFYVHTFTYIYITIEIEPVTQKLHDSFCEKWLKLWATVKIAQKEKFCPIWSPCLSTQ
jgi:hypothetical protein